MVKSDLKYIFLRDGTYVNLSPTGEYGEPALEYRDGAWVEYSGDSAELFLGRPATDEEISSITSSGTESQ
ncbi:MAG: hypothetical protein ABIB97_04500 [Patescibacteria group bacterium]